MDFFIIDAEQNVMLVGSNDPEAVFKTALDLAKEDKFHLAFIAAVDQSNKIRATLQFDYYNKRVRTQLRHFIRKYMAHGALEKHVASLKELANGNSN